MWFNKQQTAEQLKQEAQQLSAKGSVQAIKDWWNAKSKKEQAIIIGILVAASASPFIIMWAKTMVVTTFVPDATGGLWVISEAAPIWHQALIAGSMIALTGISTAALTAKFNGASVQQIVDQHVNKS